MQGYELMRFQAGERAQGAGIFWKDASVARSDGHCAEMGAPHSGDALYPGQRVTLFKKSSGAFVLLSGIAPGVCSHCFIF
ncbi:hypothetical protein ACLHDD_07530 [Pantoea sp. NSTU24]|uniref:hypothetical protein n=1 Tax=Pantoea sp. NSTU24 TaxID=3391144 RepID=UPI003D03535F